MKNIRIAILVASLALFGLMLPAQAEMATLDEALTVAKNWVTLIIHEKGNWGGSETAEVGDIHEFRRGERVIGYYCHVKPKGYVIISLLKELAAVKAYSAVNNLNPESEEGLADLLKGSMERILNQIEQRIGPVESARTEDLDKILEINYKGSWDELAGDVIIFRQYLQSGAIMMNYQEGQVLLTSDWHQGDPYNRQIPAPPPGDDCTAPHCTVGCVATAGAQIMRYWNWPPSDPYGFDWPNMPDSLTGTSPAVEINAVAELSHEVGIRVDMNYCSGTDPDEDACASSSYTYDMRGVYVDNYRYSSSCSKKDRTDYTAVGWFNLMKTQLNQNRPVHYRIPGHSIVGDGWQETGGGPTRQYHMNYGWTGTGDDTWYTLDALLGGDPDDEYMLVYIYPAPALFDSLLDWYSLPSYPYRYFDQDATGENTLFAAGHNLQFLPGIKVTCTGTPGEYIRFVGTNVSNTRLFSRGDLSRGIRIINGAIRLHPSGSIKLH